MFWGLIMEPKRRYTQTVKRPFHISMAALDIFSSNNEPCQVMLNFENRNYLLCTLQKDKDVQCILDLNFEAGNKVIFATNGDSNVHLTGYLVEDLEDYVDEQGEEEEEVDDDIAIGSKRKTRFQNQPPMKKSKTEQLLDEADNYDSNDDESFSLSKLGEDSDESASSDEDEEEDDEDGAEDEEDDEETEESDNENDEEVSSLSEDEVKDVKSQLNGVSTKRKLREVQKKAKLAELKTLSPNAANKSPKQEKTPAKSPKAEINQKANKTPKGEKTPKGKMGEGNQKNGSAVKSGKEQQAASPQKRTLEGGIIVQDIVVGDGQVVKPGKLAEVYYEGRLKQNNKLFDKLRQGPGFKFRLGKQEVIKGWDVGVLGMKVGGKRRITCPPNMAYGTKGSPPQIPPNSTLVFDVELKNIK